MRMDIDGYLSNLIRRVPVSLYWYPSIETVPCPIKFVLYLTTWSLSKIYIFKIWLFQGLFRDYI